MYKITNTDLSEEDGILTQIFTTGRIASKLSIDFQNRNEGRTVARQEGFTLDGSPLNIEDTIDVRHFSEEGKSIHPASVLNHIRVFISYCEQNNFSV